MQKPAMSTVGYGGEYAGQMGTVLMYVLHETQGYEAGDLAVLTKPDDRHVSIHFYITRKGVIYESVPLTLGANHVGPRGFVPGHPEAIARVQSVGIEMENPPLAAPYPEVQLDALDRLIAWLDEVYPSKPPIYGHREVRPPGEKDDPREFFPLDAYKRYRAHKPKEADVNYVLYRVYNQSQKDGAMAKLRELGASSFANNLTDIDPSHFIRTASFADYDDMVSFVMWAKANRLHGTAMPSDGKTVVF